MKMGPQTEELSKRITLQPHYTMMNFLGLRLVHKRIGLLAMLLFAFELKDKTFGIGYIRI